MSFCVVVTLKKLESDFLLKGAFSQLALGTSQIAITLKVQIPSAAHWVTTGGVKHV